MGDAGPKARVVSGRKIALLLKLCRTIAGVSQTHLAELMTVMFQERIAVRDISLFENGKWVDNKDFSLKVLVWLEVMGVRYHSLIMMKEWDLVARHRAIRDLSAAERNALEEFYKMSPTLSIQNLQILGILLSVTPEDIHNYFSKRRFSGQSQVDKPLQLQSPKIPDSRRHSEIHNNTREETKNLNTQSPQTTVTAPQYSERTRPVNFKEFSKPCSTPVRLPPASTFLSALRPLRRDTVSVRNTEGGHDLVLNGRSDSFEEGQREICSDTFDMSFACSPPDLKLEYSDLSNDSGFSDSEIVPAVDSWLLHKPEARSVGTRIEEKEKPSTNATYTPLNCVESVQRRASIQQALDSMRHFAGMASTPIYDLHETYHELS